MLWDLIVDAVGCLLALVSALAEVPAVVWVLLALALGVVLGSRL